VKTVAFFICWTWRAVLVRYLTRVW